MRLPIKIIIGLSLCASLHQAPAAPACQPPKPFSAVRQCKWECPDYAKFPIYPNSSPLKHVAMCRPPDGRRPGYYDGSMVISGRVERIETHTWGEILIFYPDLKSANNLPEDRQGGGIWFANHKEAETLTKAPRADSKNECWAAPAKVRISGLLTDVGDQDGNHDWTVLKSVVDIGEFKNYGCTY